MKLLTVSFRDLPSYISEAQAEPKRLSRKLRKQAESGDDLAYLRLIDLLLTAGSYDEVKEFAEMGNDLAAQELIGFLMTNDRPDEAYAIICKRREARNRVADLQLTDWMVQQDRTDELRQRVAAGDTYA